MALPSSSNVLVVDDASKHLVAQLCVAHLRLNEIVAEVHKVIVIGDRDHDLRTAEEEERRRKGGGKKTSYVSIYG